MKTKRAAADLLLYNGVVATQVPDRAPAQAVALARGRILAVGTDDALLAIATAKTERIDLAGRLVVPGFIDTHIHFYEWALKRQGLRLDDVDRLETLLDRLRTAASNRPAGQWIMGQGWNETDWEVPRMPTRDLLDQAAPRHPVLLWRCDLHLAAANSAALALAGIDAHSADPPEGRIERDASGTPTGILRELAINLVREAVAAPEAAQILEAYQEATEALYRRGVTAIHDVRLMADQDGARALGAFQSLDREGRLGLRAWVTLPGERLDDLIALGLHTGFGNDRLRLGHVKFFSDGGVGARTAWMIDPFLDGKNGFSRGLPLMEMDDLADRIRRADAAGLSVMVHAVGDRANRELITRFEKIEALRRRHKVPPLPIPHRIEHVQIIRPEDIARLRRLNLALCVTPGNMILDINLIDTAVGEMGRWAYAVRPLIESGAPVMFSSDCPVCDPSPLTGIHAAVTRQRDDGTPAEGWYPQNRTSVNEAIRAYTAVPAVVHQAHDLGTIAPGCKADLAILSENLLAAPPSRIPEVRVDMTVFNGRIVHRLF
ncbi:MAG: amidohydrolase [Desulfosarcinaceae bacterium]